MESVPVRCVDEDGKAVPNAEVLASQNERFADGSGHVDYLPVAKADGLGNLEISFPTVNPQAVGTFREVYARVDGKLAGVGSVESGQATTPMIKVILVPVYSVDGRVTVPDGFDPQKVKVAVILMSIAPTGDRSVGDFGDAANAPADAHWPDWFAATPDAHGEFQLRNLPLLGNVYLAANAAGLGEAQHVFFKTAVDPSLKAQPLVFDLHREASIEGSVVGPDGHPRAGVEVGARARGGAMAVAHEYSATTDTTGRFVLRGLPPDQKFTVWVRPVEGLIAPVISAGLLQSGEVFQLPEIRLTPGCLVQGTIKQGDTGRPLEGIRLWLTGETGDQQFEQLAAVVSSADGRYAVRAPPGEGRLSVFDVGPNRVKTDPPSVSDRELKIAATDHAMKAIDFTLFPPTAAQQERDAKPKPTVQLKVVDASGLPLGGVPVSFWESEDPDGHPYPVGGALGVTRDDGSFKGEIDAVHEISIGVGGVRFSSAKTDKFNSTTKPEYDLGTFTLRPATGFIRGVVVDGEGKPVAEVMVSATSKNMRPVGMIDGSKTDELGRFEIPHVLADELSNLDAQLPGYNGTSVKGVAAGTTDLRITLRPSLDVHLVGTWEIKENVAAPGGAQYPAPDSIDFEADQPLSMFHSAEVGFGGDLKKSSGAWQYIVHGDSLVDLSSKDRSGPAPFLRAHYTIANQILTLEWKGTVSTGVRTTYQRVPETGAKADR